MTASTRPRPTPGWRRRLRRHRRPLAAVVAALASVTAIAAVRTPSPPPAESATAPSAGMTVDEAYVPVTLTSTAVAAVLRPGDVVTLVAVDESGAGTVVASDARIIDRGAGSGFLGSASSAVLLMAVPRTTAAAVAALSSSTPVTVVVTEAAASQ